MIGLDDMIAGNKQDKQSPWLKLNIRFRKSKRDAWMQQVKHIDLLLIHDKLTRLLTCHRRVGHISPELILRQSQISGEAQNISYFHSLTDNRSFGQDMIVHIFVSVYHYFRFDDLTQWCRLRVGQHWNTSPGPIAKEVCWLRKNILRSRSNRKNKLAEALVPWPF